MANFTTENNNYCKNIVNEMEKYYNGDYIRYNGDIYNVNELETGENENGEGCYKIDGELVSVDDYDIEVLSLFDYFSDCLDIRYTFNSNRELLGVEILVCCGGPNVWVNTITNRVELFWWTERGECDFSNYISNEINSLFEDIFFC